MQKVRIQPEETETVSEIETIEISSDQPNQTMSTEEEDHHNNEHIKVESIKEKRSNELKESKDSNAPIVGEDSDNLQALSNFIKLKLDLFPYSTPGHDHVQRSFFGVFGTLVAASIMFWFIWGSVTQYSNDVTGLNAEARPLFDRDFGKLPKIGAFVNHQGDVFYDETYFKFQFKLRAIFEGDNNADRPRVNLDTPPITCNVFSRNGDNTTGTKAPKGCVDFPALEAGLKSLRQETLLNDTYKIKDIPAYPRLQGEYGSDAYWFLEINLQGCPEYGDDEGITCVNETMVEKKFNEGAFTVTMVTESQVTREYTIDSSIYLNIDYGRWTGVESYLQLTESYETDRDLPRITQPPKKLLKYLQYSALSQNKEDNTYITYYIRLYHQVNEETIEHYSLLEMFSALGGAFGLVKLVTSIIFIPMNKLIYEENRMIMKARERRQTRSHKDK